MNTTAAPDVSPVISLRLAIVLLLIAGGVLAGMDVMAKYLALSTPIALVIWGRYFFHTMINFVMLTYKRRSLNFLRAKHPKLQFIRAAALFAATTFMYISLTMMPLGDAAAIQFLAPVLVTVISGLFMGEHVGARRITAVIVAFVGVLFVARPGSNILGWVAFLPFVTAVCLSIYLVLTRYLRSKDHADVTNFYATALGSLVLTCVVPFYWQAPSAFDWGLMVSMGAAGAIGHGLWVKAFHSAEASMLAPFTYSQVLAAIIWGFLVFGDIPSLWSSLGATLIIGSGIYVWYRETRHAH